jgi:glycosyltransferase involved in cell wall biosynthesis
MQRGEHFARCYDTLLPSLERGCELLVADFGSTDIDWSRLPKVKRVVSLKLPFHKTRALNILAECAESDVLAFLDADMLVPHNYDEIVLANTKPGQAYFPICFSLHKDKPPLIDPANGWWRKTGYGNCSFMREDFYKIGRWDERFRRWGREDDDMFNRASRFLKVVRAECPGLFHQWHDTSMAFRNRYYNASPPAE